MAEDNARGNRRPGLRAEGERTETGDNGGSAGTGLQEALRRLQLAEMGARRAAAVARRGIAHAMASGDAAALAGSVEDLVTTRMDLRLLEDFRARTAPGDEQPAEEGEAEASAPGPATTEASEGGGEEDPEAHIQRMRQVFLARNPWFDPLADGIPERKVRAFARMLRLEGLEPDDRGFWIELENRIYAHLQGRAEGSMALN